MDTNGKSALCEDEERVIGANEPRSADSLQIANAALQSIGMPNRNTPGTYTSNPEYAAAVSTIFTKATNQAIMLGTDPNRVLSTSILCNSLLHDTRFRRVPIREAAPGDIAIESGTNQAGSYAGIVVDHGRIISNSRHGLQNNFSLAEIQSYHPSTVLLRYIGVQKHPGDSLANAGFNPNEPRVPAHQPGGGQWTTGAPGGVQMAPSTTVLSGRNGLLPGQFAGQGIVQKAPHSPTATNNSSGGTGAGTIDQLKLALQKLDEAYAKEVNDIKNMSGISDQEKNAALQSLAGKYNKARNDFTQRIVKLQQLAQDIAFAYGGKASDYYKALDDTDPKVQELMGLLDHLDTCGFKDAFLLALRRAQGGKSPQPADPHVLRAAMLAALGSLEDGEGAAEKSEIEGLSANKSPQNRGRNNEGRMLKDIGKEKNTRTYSTSQGDTIPDFATQKEVGDIKDTKKLSNTQQMRAQREAAQGQGADHVVYTGENTQVSRPMQHSGTKLVRRSDLGPQQSK